MVSNTTLKRVLYPSPLRYPGGKATLSPFLSKVLDTRGYSGKVTFVEPFAGGAGAALSLLFAGKVSNIIINDLDPSIYTFWKIAVFDTDRLIKKIKKTRISISEWKKQRRIYDEKKSTGFDLAFAFFFLNRTNRSGIIAGGPIGGYKQDSVWKLNSRFNKKGLIERLERLKKFKNQIEITNMDGVDLLSSLERETGASSYFIFLDPPYIKKGQLLYLNHYQREDHEHLAGFLENSILDWAMTYDDTRYIRNLYREKSVKGFTISHTAYLRKQGKEVFISPEKIRERVIV
jgi:DNA adenine methylase